MSRVLLTVALGIVVSGCAAKSPPSDGVAGILPNPTVQFKCESGEQITVRLDGVAAQLRLNGADYTLPQLSSVAGVSQFSDGRHVLEIRQGRTFFGLGRSLPRLCTPQ